MSRILSKNKTFAERAHFKRRIFERYGLVLNRFDLKDIVSMIINGSAQFITKQSCRRTVWKLRYMEKDIIVVYDKNRQTLITCLNEEKGIPTYEC